MQAEILNQVVIDPNHKEAAIREGRWAGNPGEAHAYTSGEGNDVSGHATEIGFRTPDPEDTAKKEINIRFKALMKREFPNGIQPVEESSPDVL